MALAVTLLPQPLSPTSPTSSPGATSKLTRFTAWTLPSWDAKSTVRSVSLSSVFPTAPMRAPVYRTVIATQSALRPVRTVRGRHSGALPTSPALTLARSPW